MRYVRTEIEKMKIHNAARQSTLEVCLLKVLFLKAIFQHLQSLKELKENNAAVTIQVFDIYAIYLQFFVLATLERISRTTAIL